MSWAADPAGSTLGAVGEAVGDSTTSPIRQLLADRNFRRFWISQLLYTGVTGTLRFTFVWLVVTLTEWPSAEGLVAIALGLPAMLLSVPAGAWSDRVDRRLVIAVATAGGAAASLAVAVVGPTHRLIIIALTTS